MLVSGIQATATRVVSNTSVDFEKDVTALSDAMFTLSQHSQSLQFVPYKMDRNHPVSHQGLITLCYLLRKLRKDLPFLVLPKVVSATVISTPVKINQVNILPESSPSLGKSLLFDILRKLQCLLNCMFVYLGSSLATSSVHLLHLAWVSSRNCLDSNKPNSASRLSWAAHVLCTSLTFYKRYLLEAAAGVYAKVLKVMF